MKPVKSRLKTGFSLIEMSIVILIISILISGAISVSSAALNNAKIKVTQDRFDAIYKALGSFVAKNYRLPCPASLKLTKANANYGDEEGGGDCENEGDGIYASTTQPHIIYGMVPVAALGLSDDMAEDGFGTKIGYIVHSGFTTANYPSVADASDGFSFFQNSSIEYPKIYQLPSQNQIDEIIFVLLSAGSNKYGGFNAFSSSANSIIGADIYEMSNALSSISDNALTIDTANFGSVLGFSTSVLFTNANPASDIFDDMILFKTRNQIINDYNLGFLLPCKSTTTNWEMGYSNGYAGSVVYRSTACMAPNDSITPSKECSAGANVWIDRTTCPGGGMNFQSNPPLVM